MSAEQRAAAVAAISSTTYDVCIIGGGVGGAGCALEAQTRGLRTLLIEAEDFAPPTSRSSAQFVQAAVGALLRALIERDRATFAVIRRALVERAALLANTPYLCAAIEHVIPCYRWSDLVYYGLGLRLYAAVSGNAPPLTVRILSRRQVLRKIPALAPGGLRAAVTYTAYEFDDFRLAVTLALSAIDAGATVLNHAAASSFMLVPSGRITAVALDDQIAGRRLTVRARAFVNATGTAADRLRILANPAARPVVFARKGTHVVLPLEALASETALVIPRTRTEPEVVAIPVLGRLLVGTATAPATRDAEPLGSEAEIAQLLRRLNSYLRRGAPPGSIVAAFADLEPSVCSAGDGIGARPNGGTLAIETDVTSGLISIFGGRWTTHRALAEDAIDHVLRQLGAGSVPSRTLPYLLRGASGYTPQLGAELAVGFGIAPALSEYLVRTYGTHASRVLALAGERPDGLLPIVADALPIRVQIVYSVRFEFARTLSDIIARRIGLERFGWDQAWAAAPTVSALVGGELGWSASAIADAVARYRARLERAYHAAGKTPPADVQAPC